jgi:hypothetical protein
VSGSRRSLFCSRSDRIVVDGNPAGGDGVGPKLVVEGRSRENVVEREGRSRPLLLG